MKDLKDYKEIIHKCSKCGLCQSVCPTYLETGNECSVSRGLFIMLQGVIKGDLKLTKTIEKYLTSCLKCGKCSDFCPSGIDIVQVLFAGKYLYFKRSLWGKILSVIHSKLLFNTALNILKLFFGHQKKRNFSSKRKVLYFGGCIEKIDSKSSEFVKDILNKLGYEVLETDFYCCGLPFLTSGNIPRFEEQMLENVKKILKDDFEYLVTDCSGCEWTLKEYVNYLEDEELKKKFEEIKFKNIYELILDSDLRFIVKDENKVTYHKSCHEKTDSCEELIKKIENINYVELKNKTECCGFSSLFNLKRDITAENLYKKKKENIVQTGADTVLTACIACMISLNCLFKKKKSVRIIEFLRKNCDFK